MHQLAGSPAVLDACIKTLPPGGKLSIDFLTDYIRERPDLARSPNHRRAPATKPESPRAATADTIVGLMAGLIEALKTHTRAIRCAAVVEMINGLGLELVDFGAIGGSAAQLRRSFPMTTAAPVERAAA